MLNEGYQNDFSEKEQKLAFENYKENIDDLAEWSRTPVLVKY